MCARRYYYPQSYAGVYYADAELYSLAVMAGTCGCDTQAYTYGGCGAGPGELEELLLAGRPCQRLLLCLAICCAVSRTHSIDLLCRWGRLRTGGDRLSRREPVRRRGRVLRGLHLRQQLRRCDMRQQLWREQLRWRRLRRWRLWLSAASSKLSGGDTSKPGDCPLQGQWWAGVAWPSCT